MLLFWSTISKRLRWSKNCCYLLHTGSNGRLLVELEYINKQKKTITLTHKMRPKHPSESLTTLTDLVLPSETNPLNNLLVVNY
jgi:hypothetical protein